VHLGNTHFWISCSLLYWRAGCREILHFRHLPG
jgi:hypothetical protein